MLRTIRTVFPKIIFSICFVYVMILGIFNVIIVLQKENIETFLAKTLNAESVSLGNVSNMPLVFISVDYFKITVSDDLFLEIDGLYFYYRFWKLFTADKEQILGSFTLNKFSFSGHNKKLTSYIKELQDKFIDKDETPIIVPLSNNPDQIPKFSVKKMNFTAQISQFDMAMRMMKEFHHRLSFDNLDINIKNNTANWKAHIHMESIWSNMVFLASADTTVKGTLTNLVSLSGGFSVFLNDLNLGGLPLIEEKIPLNFSLSNSQLLFDPVKNKDGILLDIQNKVKIAVNRDFLIEYDAYEEYNMLDYVFEPGMWTFDFHINADKKWYVKADLFSKQYPEFGMKLNFIPLASGDYKLDLVLNTHHFGKINAKLNFSKDRYELLPLPSGTLDLENVRFILSGLVFSGNAAVRAVPGKNDMIIVGQNVAMNGGLIGNTAVKFTIPPKGGLEIQPVESLNPAVAVYADIKTGKVDVQLDALDVDGDFVAKNIKLPVFGLGDSRYQGKISIIKTNAEGVFVDAAVTGYLDGEEQIQALFSVHDSKITIPRFYFVSQDLHLEGVVDILSQRTNTYIDISALASFHSNEIIPVDVLVTVQKNNALVTGMADNVVSFSASGNGKETKFILNANKYNLKKLDLFGSLTGELFIDFASGGWTRFALKKTLWNLPEKRSIYLDFDAQGTNGQLDIPNLQLKIGKDLFKAYGYMNISKDSGFDTALRFKRGGGIQFASSSYVWTALVDIRKLRIEDPFDFSLLKPINFLKTSDSEFLLVDLNAEMGGLWSNPDFRGRINIQSDNSIPQLQLLIPLFFKKGNEIGISNLRLRHPVLNVDSTLNMIYNEQGYNINTQTAVAAADIIKTRMILKYTKNSNNSCLIYQIPNLYVLSKQPTSISGKVLEHNNYYVFLSDDLKKGITGTFSAMPNSKDWEFFFLSDAVRLQSQGKLEDDMISSSLMTHMILNKLKLSGDIKQLKGLFEANLTARGSVENPIFNGNINLQNFMARFASLKNEIIIKDKVDISIENNTISFDDISIEATRGGFFGLNGRMEFQNQTISSADINFYSDRRKNNGKLSSLGWNLNFPYLSLSGQTEIDYMKLNGTEGNAVLSSKIKTENLSLGLELEDVVGNIGAHSEKTPNNVFLGLLAGLQMDVELNFGRGTRFFNQLFELNFSSYNKFNINGSLADNTVSIQGGMEVVKGRVSYLNKDLKIENGNLQFSGDTGDFYPSIRLETYSSERDANNDKVDVYLTFEGKLPSLELANISSIPLRSKSELYGLLGFGGIQRSSSTGIMSYDGSSSALASGAEIAENALFAAPISRRLRRIIALDTLQFKTDVLGNLTRSLSGGYSVSGLGILDGTELQVGQYIPSLSGLQFKYNLKLQSSANAAMNRTQSLDHIHSVGLGWDYTIPEIGQFGLDIGGTFEVSPEKTTPEVKASASYRKKF